MKNLNLELYKKLYLIRQAENAIIAHYPEDDMKIPMHMSMGSEAISVGVCHVLKHDDQVFGTYRSHALYLSKTGETDVFFAEMYGKTTGSAKGKAGSMHVASPEKGLLLTSAIVASSIPIAVGAAFANQYQKNNKLVAVFFGDGALDEGNFWESINIACLYKLPILFVCEDNNFAVHTNSEKRQGYQNITNVISRFNCYTAQSKTTDVTKIYKITKQAIKRIQTTGRPFFLHLYYYRYLEHVGIHEDFDAGYRSKKQFEKWYKKDPIHLQRKKLLNEGMSLKNIQKLERKIDTQIKQSIIKAKQQPFASTNSVYEHVFYEKK